MDTSERQSENVIAGLALASLSIPLGVIASILIWSIGFISAFAMLGLAAAAVFLYEKGAKSPPIKGAYGVLIIIVAGIVLSMLSVYIYDIVKFFDDNRELFYSSTTRSEFVGDVMFDKDVMSEYATSALMFLGLGAFGSFGIISNMLKTKHYATKQQASST